VPLLAATTQYSILSAANVVRQIAVFARFAAVRRRPDGADPVGGASQKEIICSCLPLMIWLRAEAFVMVWAAGGPFSHLRQKMAS
jgi:hypothetical protein